MFPEWHHAVPKSAYFKVPETLKTFRMYPISRSVYVLHWLATRLLRLQLLLIRIKKIATLFCEAMDSPTFSDMYGLGRLAAASERMASTGGIYTVYVIIIKQYQC